TVVLMAAVHQAAGGTGTTSVGFRTRTGRRWRLARTSAPGPMSDVAGSQLGSALLLRSTLWTGRRSTRKFKTSGKAELNRCGDTSFGGRARLAQLRPQVGGRRGAVRCLHVDQLHGLRS